MEPDATKSSGKMIMDTLDTLSTHQHHPHVSSAFLLTETAAAAAHHHFNVLSFETCLYKGGSGASSGGSPTPASVCASEGEIHEGPPGDLNTPVTTASDAPSFFGPSTVIEPPPITGQSLKSKKLKATKYNFRSQLRREYL